MALFFNQDWFLEKLAQKKARLSDFAHYLDISQDEMDMIWKDQKIMTSEQVEKAAVFLDASPQDIIKNAGCATPQLKQNAQKTAQENAPSPPMDEVVLRLERIERHLAELKNMIMAQNLTHSMKTKDDGS